MNSMSCQIQSNLIFGKTDNPYWLYIKIDNMTVTKVFSIGHKVYAINPDPSMLADGTYAEQ